MFSNINSVPKKLLGDKTLYKAFEFFYGLKRSKVLGIRWSTIDKKYL